MNTANELLSFYLEWHGHATKALVLGRSFSIPPGYSSVENIVVCGVGGSGVVGDYLEKISSIKSGPPIFVAKSFEVPNWVSRRTLVISISFSGNTHETISCTLNATRKGARIITVSSGGKLLAYSKDKGIPHLIIPMAPAARAAWPYLFFSTLGFLYENGIILIDRKELFEAVEVLGSREKLLSYSFSITNTLYSLLEDKRNKIVLVAPYEFAPLITRARNEFAENTKLFVNAIILPDSGHNDIEALASLNDVFYLFLHTGSSTWSELINRIRNSLRINRSSEIILEGESFLSKIVWGTWLFGVTSLTLAEKLGVNPLDTKYIKFFRSIIEEIYI